MEIKLIYEIIYSRIWNKIYHTQPKKHKLQHVCWQSATDLLQQADIRMRSHGLRQLVENKSVASCQQTCYKLIVKTCYPQASFKLFKQVVTSLQMTTLNNLLSLNKQQTFVAMQQANCCKLQHAGKIDNRRQVCDVFGCVQRISLNKRRQNLCDFCTNMHRPTFFHGSATLIRWTWIFRSGRGWPKDAEEQDCYERSSAICDRNST